MTGVTERHLRLVTEQRGHFYESIPGFFWFQEAYRRLLETLPRDKPSQFVEIGCYKGRSLAWLAVEAQNTQIPVQFHAVDSWSAFPGEEGPAIRRCFEANIAPVRDRVQIWAMPSLDAAPQFADDSLDVVFVDGDHEYAAVTADIRAWFPKLKPGGFMGGDDFMMAPVARAVCEQFAPSGYILVHGWTTMPEPQPWPSWLARKA